MSTANAELRRPTGVGCSDLLACIFLHRLPLKSDANFVVRIDGNVNIRSLRQLRVNHRGITLRGLRLAISLWGGDDHANRMPDVRLSKYGSHVLNRAQGFCQLGQPTLLRVRKSVE